MIRLGDVVVAIRGDKKDLDNTLDNAERKTRSFASNVTGFLSQSFSFAVGGVIEKAIGGITNAIGGLQESMIGGNIAFEQYATSFNVLLGNVDLAKERIKDLERFGATTPFELPGVVEADRILQAFGLHSADAAARFGKSGEEIRTIAGDVASGVGAGFDEISNYLGRFSAGATGEAIARFQELGVVTRQELAAMGVEFSKSGELVSPLDEAMTILLQVMEDKFGGMMDAQSATLGGMLSNFQDFIGQAARTLGEPIFEKFKAGLQVVLDLMQPGGNLDNAIQNASALIGQLLDLGVELFNMLTGGNVASGIDATFGKLNEWLQSAVGFVQQLRDELAGLTAGDVLAQMGPGLAELDQQMNDSLSQLEETHNKTIEQIQNQMANAKTNLNQQLADIDAKFAEQAAKVVEQAQKAIDALNRQIADKQGSFNDQLSDINDQRAKNQQKTEEEIAKNTAKLEERLTELKREHLRRRAQLVASLLTAESEEQYLNIQTQIKAEDDKFNEDVERAKKQTAEHNKELGARAKEQNDALDKQEANLKKQHEKEISELQRRIKEEKSERDKALAKIEADRQSESSKIQAAYDEEMAMLEAKLKAESDAYEANKQAIIENYEEQKRAFEESLQARAAALDAGGPAAELAEHIRNLIGLASELKAAWEEGGIAGVFDLLKEKFQEWAGDESINDMMMEKGRMIGQAIMEGIVAFFTSAGDEEGGFLNSLHGMIDGGMDSYVALGSSVATGIILGLLTGFASEEALSQLSEGLKAGIEMAINIGLVAAWPPRALEFVEGAFAQIQEMFTGLDWGSIGSSIVEGIGEGLQAGWDSLKGSIRSGIDSLMGAGKTASESSSPSKRSAREIGGPLAEGIGVGFEESIKEFKARAGRLVADAIPNLSSLTKNSQVSLNFRQENHLPPGSDKSIVDEILSKTDKMIVNKLYEYASM